MCTHILTHTMAAMEATISQSAKSGWGFIANTIPTGFLVSLYVSELTLGQVFIVPSWWTKRSGEQRGLEARTKVRLRNTTRRLAYSI